MTPASPGHSAGELPDLGMHRERYALACAAVSVSARILTTAHDFAKEPGVFLRTDDLSLVIPLAQARSAAGALSIVGGKLMAECREEAAELSPAIGRPLRFEPGVMTVGDGDRNLTIRALASATTEALAAARSLATCEAPTDLQAALAELVELAERAAEFLGLK